MRWIALILLFVCLPGCGKAPPAPPSLPLSLNYQGQITEKKQNDLYLALRIEQSGPKVKGLFCYRPGLGTDPIFGDLEGNALPESAELDLRFPLYLARGEVRPRIKLVLTRQAVDEKHLEQMMKRFRLAPDKSAGLESLRATVEFVDNEGRRQAEGVFYNLAPSENLFNK